MSETTVSWARSKRIGKGSFGTVSLGVDKSDGRVFAVKSVEQSVGFHRQIECLENEIRILRSLSSPYVVAFLADDVSNEFPTTSFRNMHMEYLPGGTVTDVATGAGEDEGGYFDEKLLRSRTWCVVSALSYVHSRGFVHCDVKGRNILVGMNPSFVKLADFGSAIEFSGDGGCGSPMVPRGSPLWMAPEVIRGESQGPKSDVWSLGCTVIEMVTGKPAWDDLGADTLSRIGYSDALPKFPSRLSEIGRDFLGKCLRRDPSERWSSDQLLQHPFLASASPDMAVESSPRCVLNWVNGDFDDDDEVSVGTTSDSDGRKYEISGKDRLGKLSTSGGPNWESDGWSPVRSLRSEAEASAAAAGRCYPGDDEEEEEEGEGTHREYANLRGSEVETEGTSSEYSEFVKDNHGRLSAEYSNPGGMEFLRERPRNNCQFKCNGGGGGGDGGSSCRRQGSEGREIIALASCIHSIKLILYYWNILMKQLVLFANYSLPSFSTSNFLQIFSRVLSIKEEKKVKIYIFFVK